MGLHTNVTLQVAEDPQEHVFEQHRIALLNLEHAKEEAVRTQRVHEAAQEELRKAERIALAWDTYLAQAGGLPS